MRMLKQLGINAKTASADLVGASTELKNKALGAIANALIQNAQKIIDANKIDYDSQLGILDGGMYCIEEIICSCFISISPQSVC